MKKKVLLLCIIIFPSLIYFVFELTQANFKKMAYFGPKTLDAKGDTVYWRVPEDTAFSTIRGGTLDTAKNEGASRVAAEHYLIADTSKYPIYCILFLDKKLHNEGYKLAGLIDYIKYKSSDLKTVPLFFISSVFIFDDEINSKKLKLDSTYQFNGEFDSIPVKLPDFIPGRLNYANRDSFLRETYFKQKPVYVFDYFMVLVDKKRHIRGYYDPSYNAEVKRMIQEYKHLKIRDEYAQTLKQNDIKQNEK